MKKYIQTEWISSKSSVILWRWFWNTVISHPTWGLGGTIMVLGKTIMCKHFTEKMKSYEHGCLRSPCHCWTLHIYEVYSYNSAWLDDAFSFHSSWVSTLPCLNTHIYNFQHSALFFVKLCFQNKLVVLTASLLVPNLWNTMGCPLLITPPLPPIYAFIFNYM